MALFNLSNDDCDLTLSEVYEIDSLNAGAVHAINEMTRHVRVTTEIGVSLDICANYAQHEDNEFLETLFSSWHTFPSPDLV